MPGLADFLRALRVQGEVTKRKLASAMSLLRRVSSPSFKGRVQAKVERQINQEGWPEKIIQRRFEVESTHYAGGTQWAPLSPATIRSRLRRGFGTGPKLFNTGALKASAVRGAHGAYRMGRPGTRFSIGRVSVRYAKYIQRGTGSMPARKFYDNPNEAEMRPINRRAAQLLARYARQEMRR